MNQPLGSGWTVTLTAAGEPWPDIEHKIDDIFEMLAAYSPALAIAPENTGITITISLDSSFNERDAWLEACILFARVRAKTGLPPWNIVGGAIRTWAEHDRELERPAYEPLAGVAEIAATLGVSAQRVSTMRRTHDGFPAPIAELKSGPVWVAAHITRFAETWDRKPGRPTKEVAQRYAEIRKRHVRQPEPHDPKTQSAG